MRVHAVLISVASLSLCALAILVIQDVLRRTEETLRGEALQQCRYAARELLAQYQARLAANNDDQTPLPPAALDLSLHGLATPVLTAHEGVHGAFVLAPEERLVGYAGPHDDALTADEQQFLRKLAGRTVAGEVRADSLASRSAMVPMVAVAVRSSSGEVTAMAARRLPPAAAGITQRQGWLAVLVALALVGLAGVVSVSMRLSRGLRAVEQGIARMERDFHYRLPQAGVEFQSIVDAINRLAERRTALEASLRRQDRLASLGRVVSGVAHEIRNPLNGIRLSMELLARRVRKGSASTAEINAAIGEVDRLEQILIRLLAFGSKGHQVRERQAMQPVLQRAVHLLREEARQKHVQLDLTVDAVGAEAEMDALEMEQVTMNLLLNALEVSPPGGRVELRMEACEDSRHGPRVRVSVCDRGPGIPAEARDHVFDPYFTTKETGNGLGLAVSREAVLRHGGVIDFESSSAGSCFWFELPLAAMEVSA